MAAVILGAFFVAFLVYAVVMLLDTHRITRQTDMIQRLTQEIQDRTLRDLERRRNDLRGDGGA